MLRNRTIVGLVLLILSHAHQVQAAEKLDLSVLYAGVPDSERAKEFASLLEQHFRSVSVTKSLGFREAEANRYDVVVFDNHSIPNAVIVPQLSPHYDRPTILVGGNGAYIGGGLRLKINCL